MVAAARLIALLLHSHKPLYLTFPFSLFGCCNPLFYQGYTPSKDEGFPVMRRGIPGKETRLLLWSRLMG